MVRGGGAHHELAGGYNGSMTSMNSPVFHPQPGENGQPVAICKPSQPTPLGTWDNPKHIATVIPGGPMPAALNGISFTDWKDLPASPAEWNAVDGQQPLDEPAFTPPPHKAAAAGVVIEEPDGRIWLVSPSNRFAGYTTTFPKGRVDPGVSLQATAIKEAFEESGLRVRITAFLTDAERTQSYTRYYLAQRTGGNPAAMGWESQAVHLVPRDQLAAMLTHPNDAWLLARLQAGADLE